MRNAELLRLQKLKESKPYKQAKKNYRHTDPYVHLTYDERISLLCDVADAVAAWGLPVYLRNALTILF